jgi:putative ABC transport system permease protein
LTPPSKSLFRGASRAKTIAGYAAMIVIAIALFVLIRSYGEQLPDTNAETGVSFFRMRDNMLGVLAAVAIVLCAVGIYGLLAYTVSQRAQEIGVRLALGAEPARVRRMILADGMRRLAVIGIVPGALGAYVAGRAMSAMLFGVAPSDPATFSTAVAVALAMAFAGSVVPALRAVRVSPMSVLRAD